MTAPVYSYTYDAYGNLKTITDPVGNSTASDPDDRITSLTYDLSGRQLTRTLPLGQSEEFRYDSLGRQVFHRSFEGVVEQNVYDPQSGRLVAKNFFDTEAQYNGYIADPPTASPTDSHAYTYDAFGRQKSYQVIRRGGVLMDTDPEPWDLDWRW